MVIFFIILFLIIVAYFTYISHQKIIKTIDEDKTIVSNEHYTYVFKLYGFDGNVSNHEISSSLVKYFGINHFINEYKNAYESVNKNDKVCKIELYICENYTIKNLIKTYEITN